MEKVILTIDTEGPRGSDPILYQVWGKIGNEYYGVPKIIELCDKYGAKGLFFVDIPEIYDYGYEKVKEVVTYILEKGHDVGVHVHPHHCPNESRHFLWEYSYDEQYDIIKKCTDAYVEMTGKYPLSFRAGKYGANNDTLKILSELGYKYDFSEFYSQKWCGIEPHFSYVLPRKFLDIVEFPVTVFKSLSLGRFYSRYDKLELTDNPKEIKHILKLYAETENDEVIILFMHSFSFLNYLDKPDNPTLKKSKIRHFSEVMEYIDGSTELKFVSEKELCNAKISETDTKEHIVKTNGIFRQILFSIDRLLGIKENKKAKRLIIWGGLALTAVIALTILLIWRISR